MERPFHQFEYVQPIGVTQEATNICISYQVAFNNYIGTSIMIPKKMFRINYRKFIELKNQWEEETIFSSNGSEIISNSAYQNIILFGGQAVPWIIRDMRKTDNHWFFALEKITGENPIKKENIGRIDLMKNDWLFWASKYE